MIRVRVVAGRSTRIATGRPKSMTAAPIPALDPYEPKLTLWQRRPHLGWGLAVFGLTAFLTFAAFPPLNIGDAGYAFALPAVLWAYRRPPFWIYLWTVLAAQVVAWVALLGWLHHVTLLGPLLLGSFVGLLIGSWYLAVWWMVGDPAVARSSSRRAHQRFVRSGGTVGYVGVVAHRNFWRFPLADTRGESVAAATGAAECGLCRSVVGLLYLNLFQPCWRGLCAPRFLRGILWSAETQSRVHGRVDVVGVGLVSLFGRDDGGAAAKIGAGYSSATRHSAK